MRDYIEKVIEELVSDIYNLIESSVTDIILVQNILNENSTDAEIDYEIMLNTSVIMKMLQEIFEKNSRQTKKDYIETTKKFS